MSQEQWTAVDEYFNKVLMDSDPVLDATIQSISDAGMPMISVTANQGKWLYMQAVAMGARKILEIGTLAGYSTIWLARALPSDGKLITLEADPKHAKVAQANIKRAGVAAKVDLRLGAALDSLPKILEEGLAPFDLVFIDADKENSKPYFEWTLKLCRRGSLIITDNVVRKGEVTNPNSRDESVQGIRALMDTMAAEPRVTATALQSVGSKGYDGMAIALVIA